MSLSSAGSAYKRPLVLAILDGWGISPREENNAVALARKPTYDRLLREFPSTLLRASEHFVGLPDGQMGNSEVGHLNIGAGRVVEMDITRIDVLVAENRLAQEPAIAAAFAHAREHGRALHLMGLVSDGGVHAHQNHLYALLRAAKEQGLERVYVHAFLDGRDTLPTSGAGYLEQLLAKIHEYGVGRIATVSGRYYAMDRDMRWEREKKASDAMIAGVAEGGAYEDAVARVRECYSNNTKDEFIVPFVVTDGGKPTATIQSGDACILFNYRADRVRQITRILARNSGLTKDDGRELPQIAEQDAAIPRNEIPSDLFFVSMTQYEKNFSVPRVIEPQSMDNLLANLLAKGNLRNLRIAETEKYAHVTYFFNGGIEKAFPGEDRVLVPSQKVATYDLAPEMSAAGVADAVIKAIDDTAFDLVVVNFANADMVAHSGQLAPTIRGVETVDSSLGRIYQSLRARGGSMLITADHGNAEQMVDPVSGGPHTSHTTNPVPFILVDEQASEYTLREGGSLRDLSPTILGLLGLDQPREMSGSDLRVRKG
ncbi:2,3-bisphosphoglycerate-independent phosphoglycerate mutase [Acidipila sp. EB88]|uniref:2,3-bisphosphoglycerate-independent phosphoglycerate mutase n=1 Tax=Acidipila sp. EB88 TaxID=2305226 RepID=UPI000F5E7C67|nr:2,3-bisphosphoglycerate-independent phosphoglycerate mutase [Acidipila sp. EB88]RRA49718.1 2,3-bisphosphoglycerate-independent phosphoglycerate mutase [Acidipila sp. EB88]